MKSEDIKYHLRMMRNHSFGTSKTALRRTIRYIEKLERRIEALERQVKS